MARRYFINLAPTVNISPGINSGATTCSAPSFAGWPTSYPFTATFDYGLATAEVVLVTNIAGTVATITRGYDGTTAVAHASGATLDCTPTAKDFDEANSHVNASTGVHGVSGSVVGTSDVQTLTNKSFTGTTAMGQVNASGVTATGTVQGATVTSTGAVNGASAAITGAATAASVTATGQVQGGTVVSTGALTAGSVSTAGAVNAGSAAITNGVTAASATVTGAVQGGSLAATGSAPTITGIPVVKSYTNEAAASAATSTVNAVVYLTAPTTTGYTPGHYWWTGTVWHPMPGGVMGTANTATQFTSTGTNGVTETLDTGLAVTIAGIVSGKTYRIAWGGWYRATVAATEATAVIHASQSAITTASPTIGGCKKYIAQTSAGPEDTNEFIWTATANGTWNFQLGIKSTLGTGASAISGGFQNSFLTVYAAS